MNLSDAEELLELSEGYTELDIKQNYRKLIMKYHPDKCKNSSEQFIKIQKAYHYLTMPKSANNIENIDLFKTFNDILKKFPQFNNKKFEFKKTKVPITIKEYFTGISKNIKVPRNCNCDKSLCMNCAGCGYDILSGNVFKKSLDVCMECIGDGYISICNCYDNIKLDLNPLFKLEHKLFDISLIDDNYFFENNKLYYNFDISFKESLIGFKKTFIDPLGKSHNIIVNEILKKGDGYSIKINNIIIGVTEIVLIFNVIYPKKLNSKLRNILVSIEF